MRSAATAITCTCAFLPFHSAFVHHEALPAVHRTRKQILQKRPPSQGATQWAAATDDDTSAPTASTTSSTPFFEFPRDAVSLGYLAFGSYFTAINVAGYYDDYERVCTAALALGSLSAAAMVSDAVDPPASFVDAPKGYVTRRCISRFGAAYMVAAMWVCFRTSPLCAALLPPALVAADPPLRAADVLCNVAAAGVFIWGVAAPLSEELFGKGGGEYDRTDVQQLLLRGSIAQNIIGATFLPVVLAMAVRGPLWWDAVHEVRG